MKFKKSLLFILIITLLSITITGCGSKNNDKVDINSDVNSKDKITVAVSVVLQETFAKAVSGDLINVATMIPPGNSPENYQPAPKEMTNLSESKIYFAIGVPTEKVNILSKIEEFNKDIEVVSLDKKVGEVYSDRY